MPGEMDGTKQMKIKQIQEDGILEAEPYPDRADFRTSRNQAMGRPIGRPIELLVNHFQLDFGSSKRYADWRINAFDVIIEVHRTDESPSSQSEGAVGGSASATEGKRGRKKKNGNKNGATAPASNTAGHQILRESTDTTEATFKVTKQLPRALNRMIFRQFLDDYEPQLKRFHIGYDGGKLAYALPGLDIKAEGTTWTVRVTTANPPTTANLPNRVTTPSDRPQMLSLSEIAAVEFAGRAPKINMASCAKTLGDFIENDRKRRYSVTLRPAMTGYEIEMSELVRFINGEARDRTNVMYSKHMMAFSVILQQIPSLAYIPVGRSFYSPNLSQDISGGLMLYHGFFFSMRACQWGLDAVVDVSGTAFVKEGDVVDVLTEHIYGKMNPQEVREYGFYPQDVKKASQFLRNLKIKMKHTGHRVRVVKVTDKPIEDLVFPIEEGGQRKMKKVMDYFNEKYPNFKLKYPKLQAIHVGNPEKATYMPMELAMIPAGQSYLSKLAAEQTSEIIKVMARPPAERFKRIEGYVKQLNEMNSKVLEQHGIRLEISLRTVEGQVLNPVPIEVGGAPNNKQYLEPENGTWNMGNQQKFLSGKDIGQWAIFSFLRSPHETQRFAEEFIPKFQEKGRELGMIIPNPSIPAGVQVTVENFQTAVNKFAGDAGEGDSNKYIIVFLAGQPKEYETVKNTCDKGKRGVRSQCITMKSLRKLNDSLLKQFVLKTNGKCGGINYVPYYPDVRFLFERMIPIMVVGADVTHPSPGNKNVPSLVALVSSQDKLGVDYFTQTRAQQQGDKGATEYIVEMKLLMRNAIQRFFEKNGAPPRKILFYRDGVGEGQFQEVRTYEIAKIQEACRELGTQNNRSYTPGITFIVCQKRHHTRFNVKDPRDGKGRSGNIPAGTAVDKQVVHPYLMDFWLCSHEGIQGTSKPTHYFVLWDDNNVSREGLLRLTFSFCHGYFRCARAVSIPAPCYYAHLAAFRAKIHIDDYMEQCGNKAPQISKINMILDVEQNPIMKNNMYFL
ncbi:unnamed protein product [Cyprideis torosa]|uniref:Uncharacterized protein n=1 Tax=Cyprideis torosa TaxID=163714 RepID=A0A7R8WDB1_9CRUS|nr:unnamed protein product [Cyprideis torosa]CAG0894414.1 unnamed protein product [Cyprideis torosa]